MAKRRRKPSAAPRFTAMQSDPVTVAQRLLGQRLVRVLGGRRLSGIIVEVEAYLGEADLAAHTYGGRRTPRTEAMYLPGGHAYVYFTYGMHHCLNVVCGHEGEGVAVLVRALVPDEGIDLMWKHRPKAKRAQDLCSGPGRLAQALQIDLQLNGIDLRTSPDLFIERIRTHAPGAQAIIRTPRIGLNAAMNRLIQCPRSGKESNWFLAPLRFLLAANPILSSKSP